MAAHSSILAWKISRMEKPDRLQSQGHKESDMTEVSQHFQKLNYNVYWEEFLWVYPICRRRRWHPTPVLSPGKSHGWRSLVRFHFSLSCIGGGNGNPLQCSCLENPREGGAWWAAVSEVTESDTTEATQHPICGLLIFLKLWISQCRQIQEIFIYYSLSLFLFTLRFR